MNTESKIANNNITVSPGANFYNDQSCVFDEKSLMIRDFFDPKDIIKYLKSVYIKLDYSVKNINDFINQDPSEYNKKETEDEIVVVNVYQKVLTIFEDEMKIFIDNMNTIISNLTRYILMGLDSDKLESTKEAISFAHEIIIISSTQIQLIDNRIKSLYNR